MGLLAVAKAAQAKAAAVSARREEEEASAVLDNAPPSCVRKSSSAAATSWEVQPNVDAAARLIFPMIRVGVVATEEEKAAVVLPALVMKTCGCDTTDTNKQDDDDATNDVKERIR